MTKGEKKLIEILKKSEELHKENKTPSHVRMTKYGKFITPEFYVVFLDYLENKLQ